LKRRAPAIDEKSNLQKPLHDSEPVSSPTTLIRLWKLSNEINVSGNNAYRKN
jgi:hypothetical protein